MKEMEANAMTNKIYFIITGTRFFEGDSFFTPKVCLDCGWKKD